MKVQLANASANLQGPVRTEMQRVITGVNNIGQTYARYLRGEIRLLHLTAAEVSSTTNFDSTGLGKNDFLGWAICNGNNGTEDLRDVFLRFSVAAAGVTGGADSIILASTQLPTHTHPIKGGSSNLPFDVTVAGADDPNAYGFLDDLRSSSGGSAAYFEAKAQTGTTGQAIDNRPAFYTLVPVKRVLP